MTDFVISRRWRSSSGFRMTAQRCPINEFSVMHRRIFDNMNKLLVNKALIRRHPATLEARDRNNHPQILGGLPNAAEDYGRLAGRST